MRTTWGVSRSNQRETMANRWGLTFLVALGLLVCFTRTAQGWQSTPNNGQNPTGQKPFNPDGPFPTEPVDPSHPWYPGSPGQNPVNPPGQNPVKKPGWQKPYNSNNWQGQNPPNPEGQKPVNNNWQGQNPSGQNPGGQNPGGQNPGGQNPVNPPGQGTKSDRGLRQGPYHGNPPVWNVPPPGQSAGWLKPGQNAGWQNLGQNSGGQNPGQNSGGQNPGVNPPVPGTKIDWPFQQGQGLKSDGSDQKQLPPKGALIFDHSRQHTKNPEPYHPTPPINSCDVYSTARVPCGSDGIPASDCEALNCCYNGGMCYFGKVVTVQCTKDAQFIVVVARDATLPNIDLETISLLGEGPGCTSVDSNSAFAIFQFPVTSCGTVVAEEPGMIIYENRMTSSYEVAMGPMGAITRDSSYDLLFQCRYTAKTIETQVAEVLQLDAPPLFVSAMGPISVQLRLGNGQCLTKGCDEVDVAYNSFYAVDDYPVTRILRDPVYVEVQLMDRTDPHLVLNLGRCWTTASANPHSLPQWDILIGGCPNRDDRYRSTLVPVGSGSGLDFPSHYRRFVFQMFTFVDPSSLEPQREQVYIHCSTSVCNAGAGFSCEPNCFSRRRRAVKDAVEKVSETKIVVSSGPIQMVGPTA
ncbi:zona pellucida sperm-binding protein 4-like [Vanacampus margaritifer]